jgi:hypothetical protein
MKPFLVNWKTTAAGVAMILGAAADVLHQLSTGMWDANRLQADFVAFTGGVGLVFAKDGSASI